MTAKFRYQIFTLLKLSFFIGLISLFIVSCGSAQTTTYEGYAVKEGESVASIARARNISESVIYNLNPESRNGLKPNSVLILPASKESKPSSDKGGIMHTVQRKETLFGIAGMYNVSVDDLRRANKELYTRDLQVGEQIHIPVPGKDGIKNIAIDLPEGYESYEIQPKDTKFGIAKKFGISVGVLETLNPELGETLEIGHKIIVPTPSKTSEKEEKEIDFDKYQYYEVQPREGFYRLKVKFGLTEEEIIALNPEAKDGLKTGMIIKIPKVKEEEKDIKEPKEIVVENLEKKIDDKSMKNIALMLPFRLSGIPADSTSNDQERLRRDASLRIALDFYSGALIAAEMAKEKGISVTLNVFDTENDINKVNSIISGNDFRKMDAVIGPVLQKNVERVSALLANDNIPVFSPLSNRDLEMSPNLFQTIPTNVVLQNLMVQYLSKNSSGKNVIVISDSKYRSQERLVVEAIPSARTLSVKENYLSAPEITNLLSNDRENWVVLLSDKPILISSSVNLLGNLASTHKIRLFTLDRNQAYDWHEVSTNRLAKLHFTFPSVNKNIYEDDDPFIRKYKSKYGVIPNRYAIRGYDITYDVLLRLAAGEDLFEEVSAGSESVYVENKFRYTKDKRRGFTNQAAYIMKFNEDLKFEVVE